MQNNQPKYKKRKIRYVGNINPLSKFIKIIKNRDRQRVRLIILVALIFATLFLFFSLYLLGNNNPFTNNIFKNLFETTAPVIYTETPGVKVNIQKKGEYAKVPEDAVFRICDYFKVYYGVLGRADYASPLPKSYSFSQFYLKDSFDFEKDFAAFSIYLESFKNFGFKNASLILDFSGKTSVATAFDGDYLWVTVTENAVFESNNVLSSRQGITHTFCLKDIKKSGFLIYEHSTDSSFDNFIFNKIYDKMSLAGVRYKEAPKSLRKKFSDEVVLSFTNKKVFLGETPRAFANYEYDRNAATKYAITNTANLVYNEYGKVRNADYIIDSKITDADFAFISECLFKSGIPYFTSDSFLWKYYGSYMDNSNNQEGFSKSWAFGNEFFNALFQNPGSFGIKGHISSPENAQIGDIIQFYSEDNVYESCIITCISEGEIFVTGHNTNDVLNFPISLFPYENIRIIKITGYNK